MKRYLGTIDNTVCFIVRRSFGKSKIDGLKLTALFLILVLFLLLLLLVRMNLLENKIQQTGTQYRDLAALLCHIRQSYRESKSDLYCQLYTHAGECY